MRAAAEGMAARRAFARGRPSLVILGLFASSIGGCSSCVEERPSSDPPVATATAAAPVTPKGGLDLRPPLKIGDSLPEAGMSK